MTTVNFSEINLVDIEGNKLELPKGQEVHKILGNLLYSKAKKLELVDIARKIHSGEQVELRDDEIAEIIDLVKDPQSGFFSFVQYAIINHIEKK